jgi:hypothetical protein
MREDGMHRMRRTHWREEECIQGFGRKSEGNRPLQGHRCTWQDNIRMDFREIDGTWTGLLWLRI